MAQGKSLRQKRAWVVGQELCMAEEQGIWWERLAGGQSMQGLVSLEKEFEFCYICKRIAIFRLVLLITLPMKFLIGILGKPIASNEISVSN